MVSKQCGQHGHIVMWCLWTVVLANFEKNIAKADKHHLQRNLLIRYYFEIGLN